MLDKKGPIYPARQRPIFAELKNVELSLRCILVSTITFRYTVPMIAIQGSAKPEAVSSDTSTLEAEQHRYMGLPLFGLDLFGVHFHSITRRAFFFRLDGRAAKALTFFRLRVVQKCLTFYIKVELLFPHSVRMFVGKIINDGIIKRWEGYLQCALVLVVRILMSGRTSQPLPEFEFVTT